MSEQQLELRPRQVTAYGDEFFKWCDRQDAGEVHICTVEVKGNGHYLLHLSWPATAQPVESKPVEKTAAKSALTVEEEFNQMFQ